MLFSANLVPREKYKREEGRHWEVMSAAQDNSKSNWGKTGSNIDPIL
jgi:hypothetical protein